MIACTLVAVALALSQQAVASTTPTDFRCGMQEAWLASRERAELAAGSCVLQGPCDDPLVRDAHGLSPAIPGKVVQLRILVLREDDGSNPAASPQDVERQVRQLNRNFARYRVRFEHTWEYIDDSTYRITGNTLADWHMKHAYAQDTLHRCHIWVTGSGSSYGTFPWMQAALQPLGGVVIDELPFRRTEDVLTHELGHILGLWHTFHGVEEVTPCSECYETPDRALADTVGDYCADTPATPELLNCVDPGGNDPCSSLPWGQVLHTDYMSYGIDCWSEFTPEQAARMHCWSAAKLSTWWRCSADLDADGDIDRDDLAQLLAAYGPHANHPADLNGDRVVDVRDARLLLAWARIWP